ncbi:hypothetical protein MMC30_005012 [Trapelia coarctata]|nr:hypothetical protein [Trapelia coarctata]
MNSASDPFPASLPHLDSPQNFDSDMVNSMQGADLYFNSALHDESPGRFFGDDILSPFQSPVSFKTPNPSTTIEPSATSKNYSASPESSLQDSSSESSGRRQRRTSSKSSSSGLAGREINMMDAPPNGWKSENITNMAQEPAFDFSGANLSNFNNNSYDLSNRAMENDFDFDSAASSPSPGVNASNPVNTGNRCVVMPHQVSPSSGASLVPHPRSSMGTRETSPMSAMMHSGYNPQISPASSNEDYIGGGMVNGMQQLSTWPRESQAMFTAHGLPMHHLQATVAPEPAIAPSALGSFSNVPNIPPRLTIHPTPHKSRVETQIQIKMTLFPMPQGIKRLHLPAHTISKPKLLAKPPPAKAPDMLELYTMLVCTSAMQDPHKMKRAFARAAQGNVDVKKPESRRSSSGESTTVAEDEDHPLNGGPVHICDGCILRERKRAARKKSKKPEEEEPWQKDEAKRIIVFNTTEVKEWTAPSDPNDSDSGEIPIQGAIVPPDNAMQVDVPMRIACYCRHQHEKMGFQVIFTIKDYEDKVVAQAITHPIVITDDHKTHAPPLTQPPPGAMFADPVAVPGGNAFERGAMENYVPPFHRNAHSTTDLQSLQQSYHPHFMPQNISPFAMPPNPSHTTSATLTPRHSRQASPSAQSGPVLKKRKASGSGMSRVIPDSLTMTTLPSSGPNMPNQNWTTAATSNPVSPSVGMSYPPNFQSIDTTQYGSFPASRSAQFNTGPPTPNSNDPNFISNANRSQSLENLAVVQQMFSAPNSTRPSRAPSPTSVHHNANGLQNSHVPTLVNTAMGYPNTISPQRQPTIHKLIPNEGTKAGGIEVTCLGSGFCQGLEVMFGEAQATTTTYWGETSLVCLLPPAARAGTVVVTFKHQRQQQMQHAVYPSPPISKQQVLFKYVDDDEQELVRHALLLVHHKMTGSIEDVGEIARRIISQGQVSHGSGSWSRGNSQGGDHMRQAANFQACLTGTTDVESAVLKCVDLLDYDDSPFQADLNLQRSNGQTMLHLAASLGYYRLVAGLLARGANPDVRDRNGMSPMHMAALHGQSQIIRRLRLAGGDPTLRSLLGYTPADMATSRTALDAVQALQSHSRTRSAGTSTVSLVSQAGSTSSVRSLGVQQSRAASFSLDDYTSDEGDDEEAEDSVISPEEALQHSTAVRIWAESRRNSNNAEPDLRTTATTRQHVQTTAPPSPAAAMTAWRDHLAAQIQQFQQSVNWTMPNLQMPTLPPMPYLPDYGRFVPQRSPRPSIGNPDAKESDSKWWEILTGSAPSSSAPPAYDEIYPAKAQETRDLKTESAARAATDAIADQKAIATFDVPQKESSVGTMSSKTKDTTKALAVQLQKERNDADAREVKRIRSDKNLWFIWIPLLVMVMMLMLYDRVPQVLHAAQQALGFMQNQYGGRVVHEIL